MERATSLNRLYSLLAGMLVATITVLLMAILFFSSIRSLQDTRADTVFGIIDRLENENLSILRRLNALGAEDCTKENLLYMREALFESAFAKEIMFHRGEPGICTTGSGVLDKPVFLPPPDVVTVLGSEVWLKYNMESQLTNFEFAVARLKLGRYSMLVDVNHLAYPDTEPFDWQLVFLPSPQNPQMFMHVDGTAGLYNQELPPSNTRLGSILYYQTCDSKRPNLCFVLTASFYKLFDYYLLVLGLAMMLVLSLSYISINYFRRWLESRAQLQTRVVKGLKANLFFWHYQPIVDLHSDQVVGCEVLSRFRDEYGEIPPKAFLQVIRETGQTWFYTRLMIESVLPTLESHEELPGKFKVCFNVFPCDVISGAVKELASIRELTNSRFDVTVEITEDQHLDDHSAHANLGEIYQNGILISIDDFGTGYSNLGQLKRLNGTYLKIDKSYVRDIEETSIKSSLIPHVVSIAEQLDLEIIAEGIENRRQRILLTELGVRYGQGWLFGQPMPAEDLIRLIAYPNRLPT